MLAAWHWEKTLGLHQYGVLRVTHIDCDLFPGYLCQHLLLCDTCHCHLHHALAHTLLHNRMDPKADGDPNIGGAVAPDIVPPCGGTTPLFSQMRGAPSCLTWMAFPPIHWARAPGPWPPSHSHSSLSLHLVMALPTPTISHGILLPCSVCPLSPPGLPFGTSTWQLTSISTKTSSLPSLKIWDGWVTLSHVQETLSSSCDLTFSAHTVSS